MQKIKPQYSLTMLLMLVLINVVLASNAAAKDAVKIAFLADIHLHDPYQSAKGLDAERLPKDPVSGKPLLLRSMNAQLHSTRLFNENYWVLRAALNDIASKGIKLVALPGDFSDDGQPANIKALSELLSEYAMKFGMRFYAMNGNHDPTRPFSRPGGKTDFLALQGNEISVGSKTHPACQASSANECSDELQEWGYAEIVSAMSSHGFMPHRDDQMFETPFASAEMAKRQWQWCDKQNQCIGMPDTSYLVEPVNGIWLLAIDANVYRPIGEFADGQFQGSGNAGYNALLEYKPQLIDWITKVAARAKAQGKKLIAFSHFPMADFYDQTAPDIATLFGKKAMQLPRLPLPTTTQSLAATGLTLHFAGHMHLYDVYQSPQQKGLLNIQVPSLAAYQPGYTVLTVNENNAAQIDTVIIKDVPEFSRWFELYKPEWQYRQQHQISNWNADILKTQNYLDFTDAHLRQIIRQRYLPREWPAEVAVVFQENTVPKVLATAGCKLSPGTDRKLADAEGLLFIDDYYRARNAGSFAHLEGRRPFYRQLAQQIATGQCDEAASPATTPELKQILLFIATGIGHSEQDPPSIPFAFD